MHVKNIAVIGSGVMGSGIAALCANAGCRVLLLDIVPKGAENRNALAEKAVEKQLASGSFTHPQNAGRITCGNMEDHLPRLAEADWIIEAVLEKLDIKQNVYRRVDGARKPGSVVSSNTSTIPIHELAEGLSESFGKDLMIAHFFNPPRHMRLLEVVAGEGTRRDAYEAIKHFADERLGKEVVECKDTPGFIANRIGVFWMVAGLQEALRLGSTVEQADAAMGKAAGMPKTGIFGLYDLIGIDLIPLIADEMLAAGLPQDDAFRLAWNQPELLQKMIADGYTGRKGKGGFYRMVKKDGQKAKEVLDLKTGQYRPEEKPALASAKARNLRELVAADDIGGRYAWAVLSQTLLYAASLIPEISDDIVSVDAAMKNGYSWKMGPFEMIDAIGADAFAARLKKEGKELPPLLQTAESRSFYADGKYLTREGSYSALPHTHGHLWLADVKRGAKPVLSNPSASLWDMGDGIACLELTAKMSTVDEDVLAMVQQAVARVPKDFQGLVIGNDSEVFSAGANLHRFLDYARGGQWQALDHMIAAGQAMVTSLRYAPFPAVASLSGLALGGGCEIALHMAAVQAHMETRIGLVEAHVGVIPAWGGSSEMLRRYPDDVLALFALIMQAKTSSSAEEASDMRILRSGDGISMNRARVLADAKRRCLGLVKDYRPPVAAPVAAGGEAAKRAMLQRLDSIEGLAPHDKEVGRVLAQVLSGGVGKGTVTEQSLLDLEREGFVELMRTPQTQARIEHMLNTGKPLKN